MTTKQTHVQIDYCNCPTAHKTKSKHKHVRRATTSPFKQIPQRSAPTHNTLTPLHTQSLRPEQTHSPSTKQMQHSTTRSTCSSRSSLHRAFLSSLHQENRNNPPSALFYQNQYTPSSPRPPKKVQTKPNIKRNEYSQSAIAQEKNTHKNPTNPTLSNSNKTKSKHKHVRRATTSPFKQIP